MGQSTLCLHIATTLSSEALQCCKDSANPCKRMGVTGQGTSVFSPSPPEYFEGAVNSLKESSMTPILKTLGWMVIGRKWWSILFVKNNSYVLHVAQFVSPYRSTQEQCMDEVNYYSNMCYLLLLLPFKVTLCNSLVLYFKLLFFGCFFVHPLL